MPTQFTSSTSSLLSSNPDSTRRYRRTSSRRRLRAVETRRAAAHLSRARVTTSSVPSSGACPSGSSGGYICYISLSTLSRSHNYTFLLSQPAPPVLIHVLILVPQAELNPGNRHRPLLHILRDLRRSRVLAHPRRVLHHPLRSHHAPANPVRTSLYSFSIKVAAYHTPKAHDQVQVCAVRSRPQGPLRRQAVRAGGGLGG